MASIKVASIKEIRKQQAAAIRDRRERIARAYQYLLDLEEQTGHCGVLRAFQMWFSKPKRGKFL